MSSIANKLWNKVTERTEDADKNAVFLVMDSIIRDTSFRELYKTIMLGNNASTVLHNQQLSTGKGNSFTGAAEVITTGLLDTSMITTTVAMNLTQQSPYASDIFEKTMVEPNIEGVPISTSSMTCSREVDVGEQMMVVQSSSQKQYWTDNAVPKLREWNIEGYITPSLQIDRLYLIRPSLKMQLKFLDTCAVSRRPVLFKDNRGDFLFVQIMNLQSTEDPTYNNAIKVNISLKEYKPFTIRNNPMNISEAVTDPASIADASIIDLQKWGDL